MSEFINSKDQTRAKVMRNIAGTLTSRELGAASQNALRKLSRSIEGSTCSFISDDKDPCIHRAVAVANLASRTAKLGKAQVITDNQIYFGDNLSGGATIHMAQLYAMKSEKPFLLFNGRLLPTDIDTSATDWYKNSTIGTFKKEGFRPNLNSKYRYVGSELSCG